jgi:hypothetical protein
MCRHNLPSEKTSFFRNEILRAHNGTVRSFILMTDATKRSVEEGTAPQSRRRREPSMCSLHAVEKVLRMMYR